tara:strand:- start:92 stop:607 length:516 start_codon:yes stop_codon:yes gene_type:complete
MNLDNTDLVAAVSGVGNETSGEQWNMSLVEQLTSLEGRINRLRYLTISILYFIAALIYLLPVGLVIGIVWAITGLPEFVFDFFFGLAMIPMWYCGYAITVKRLQDMNWGGGSITYLQIYMVLCIIWGMAPIGSGVEYALDLITAIMGIPLIVCLFAPGEKGPNRFGPDPLG